MAKKLKMGFAMGGGVSLGSFSGGGLSEAIKQAVLYGGYYEDVNGTQEFKLYSNVEIDVFSGASAGSMALAIMLRGLVHQTAEEREQAVQHLKDEGIDANTYENNKKEQIIAAQVVQDLQRAIWVNEINMAKLLGTTDKQREDLTFEAGIVRRGALEDIANAYFKMKEAGTENFPNRCILADEVLFASTLSNLTGITYNTRPGGADSPNYIGSRDPDTSQEHKEIRVFHLMFDKQDASKINSKPKEYPSKWMRYHTGPKQQGVLGDLRENTVWARIVATSMACGAFPFAFEPVPLERFKFEYGDCWPHVLDRGICDLAMGIETSDPDAELSYPFCYVDGGTFNNEPVREAFRLAAFLDAGDDDEFDRVIVFVDPSVGSEDTDFRMPFGQQFEVRKPRKLLPAFAGNDLVKNGTLDRLIPQVFTLLGMITDEGRVKESNKIMAISDLFKKRDQYYEIFESLMKGLADPHEALQKLIPILEHILDTEKMNTLLPVGALSLNDELLRVIRSEKERKFEALKQFIRDGEPLPVGTMTNDMLNLLLRALLIVYMDLLMDLSGKSQDNKLIAIAPVVKRGDKRVAIDLPGSPLAAFSGFASTDANNYAIELARYCTRDLMMELGMLKAGSDIGKEPEAWGDAQKQKFKDDFNAQLEAIDARIDALLVGSHVVNMFPIVDNTILKQVSKMIKVHLADLDLYPVKSISFLFRIGVNDDSLEIAGEGERDNTRAMTLGGKLYLITQLNYLPDADSNAGSWDGAHEQDGKLVIKTDGFFNDKLYCTIELPAFADVMKADLMPNPTFTYTLSAHDKGKALGGNVWKITSGLRLVEQELLK